MAKSKIWQVGHEADAASLAAEVERLRAELAAVRAQVAKLEAQVDIDPLLDIPNRRAFERELRRSLAYVRRTARARH